jgi:hypothetical protein
MRDRSTLSFEPTDGSANWVDTQVDSEADYEEAVRATNIVPLDHTFLKTTGEDGPRQVTFDRLRKFNDGAYDDDFAVRRRYRRRRRDLRLVCDHFDVDGPPSELAVRILDWMATDDVTLDELGDSVEAVLIGVVSWAVRVHADRVEQLVEHDDDYASFCDDWGTTRRKVRLVRTTLTERFGRR